MAVLNSYGIVNPEGGVGKSTIAFHLAGRYAERHPKQNVLVIDLSPQAHLSMMLLGGGIVGEAIILDHCRAVTPKTILSYLSSVISGGRFAPLPDPHPYLVQVNSINPFLTDNVYLLCGDGNLEPTASAIHDAAAAPAITRASQPWKWIHVIIRRFIENVTQQDCARDWTVFVDTPSSFSVFTELAVSAVDRLIMPVSPDDSSGVALSWVFVLLRGQVPPHPMYGSSTFAGKATRLGVQIPELHLVIGNRISQYGGAPETVPALSEATAETLWTTFLNHPAYFTTRPAVPKTLAQFRKQYAVSLRDFNTAGVVASHLGRRMSQMQGGDYDIHGNCVQLSDDRIIECLNSIDDVLEQL